MQYHQEKKIETRKISTKREDEIIALKEYQEGQARTLVFISHHLGDQVTSSFHCNSIVPDDLNDFSVSAKGRTLDEKCGDCVAPVFTQSTATSKSESLKYQTLAESFRNGIKQEPDLLYQLKDYLQWDQ